VSYLAASSSSKKQALLLERNADYFPQRIAILSKYSTSKISKENILSTMNNYQMTNCTGLAKFH
jgi:hypothetical protein